MFSFFNKNRDDVLKNKIFIHTDNKCYLYDVRTMEVRDDARYYRSYRKCEDENERRIKQEEPQEEFPDSINREVLEYIYRGDTWIKSSDYDIYQRSGFAKVDADYLGNSSYLGMEGFFDGESSYCDYWDCIFNGVFYKVVRRVQSYGGVGYFVNGKELNTPAYHSLPLCFAVLDDKLVFMFHNSVIEIGEEYATGRETDVNGIKNIKVLGEGLYEQFPSYRCSQVAINKDRIVFDDAEHSMEHFLMSSLGTNNLRATELRGIKIPVRDIIETYIKSIGDYEIKIVYTCKINNFKEDVGILELIDGSNVVHFNYGYTSFGFYYIVGGNTYTFDVATLFSLYGYEENNQVVLIESKHPNGIVYYGLRYNNLEVNIDDFGNVRIIDRLGHRYLYNILEKCGLNAMKRTLLLGNVEDKYKIKIK